jgi:hypothetical protein
MAKSKNYFNNKGPKNNGNGRYKNRSGAKKVVGSNGRMVIVAWRYKKGVGLQTFLATDTSKTKISESKSGRKWSNIMVKVTEKDSGQSRMVSGLQSENGIVIIQDMGIKIVPYGKNGGFVTKFQMNGK